MPWKKALIQNMLRYRGLTFTHAGSHQYAQLLCVCGPRFFNCVHCTLCITKRRQSIEASDGPQARILAATLKNHAYRQSLLTQAVDKVQIAGQVKAPGNKLWDDGAEDN